MRARCPARKLCCGTSQRHSPCRRAISLRDTVSTTKAAPLQYLIWFFAEQHDAGLSLATAHAFSFG